jgi:hypothetical protein
MRNLPRMLSPWTVAGIVAYVMGISPMPARGEEHKTNACGCYQNTAGQCICTRKSKCDCPGECEPKGCDEKRQKELDKQIKEETQKAQAAEKKRQEEAAEKQRKLEEKANAEEDSATTDDTAAPQEETSTEGKGKDKIKSTKGKIKSTKGKKDESPSSDST